MKYFLLLARKNKKVQLEKKFGEKYSKNYDQFYKKKDYIKECDYLENLFKKYNQSINSILDIGCGTGGHLIELKKRGYDVTGIDKSQYMLDIAKEKMEKDNIRCELYCSDIINFNIERKFDVVISMFTVMGYMNSNNKLSQACKNIFNHINSNGNFIFDAWHGSAVLMDPPRKISRNQVSNNKEFIRHTHPKLNTFNHTVSVNYNFIEKENGKTNFSEQETHVVRYFFPQEITYILREIGFKKIDCYPFMSLENNLTSSDWNMTVVGIK